MPGIKDVVRVEELIDLEAGEVASSAGLLLGGDGPQPIKVDARALLELVSDKNLVSHRQLDPPPPLRTPNAVSRTGGAVGVAEPGCQYF